MGEVYAAHRSDRMFDQQVAIKLLRPESVAHSELFDRERRLLAGLEHPGIARLIDGGVAPDGRPYMAMEYVTGEPIDAWCRTHDADLATRLGLLCDGCEGGAYESGRASCREEVGSTGRAWWWRSYYKKNKRDVRSKEI